MSMSNWGVLVFLIFDPKHRLWVLITGHKNGIAKVILTCTRKQCFEQNYFVCLFVLRFNVPVNNVSVMSGWSHSFLVLTSTQEN